MQLFTRSLTALMVVLAVGFPTSAYAQRPRSSGSIAALNGAVTLGVGTADGTVTVLVSAVCTCTLTFEVSIDGSTWTAQTQTQNLSSGAIASTTTTTGTYVMPVSGHQRARVRASAYTSGTATIAIAASAAPSLIAQGGIWSQRVQDGIGNALTSKLAGSERAITVAVVDASGNQVTSFGGAGGTASNFGSSFPSQGTAAGFSDGTNMQGARVVDLDTSGAIQYGLIANLVRRSSGGPAEMIGQGTMSTSLPVVIASDQSVISDNLSQVAGTTTAAGSGVTTAGTLRVTLANDSTGVLASIGAISTSITPGTSAAHLGKAEDAVAGSGDTGIAMLAQREDTPSATAANNDYIVPKTDGVGRMWVNCGAGCSGGTQYGEDTVAVDGDTLTLAGAVRRDSAAVGSGSDGDRSTINVDANGRLWSNIFGVTQTAGTYLTVRFSDGSNYTALGTDYTHDAALTMASSAGPLLTGRASATAPADVSANDDAVAIWALRNGSLVTNLAAGGTLITATSTSLNVNCTGGCSGGTQYAEDSAHVSADTVTMAGVVQQTADAALSSDGDRSVLQVDANGYLKVNIKAGAGAGGTALADDAAFTVGTTNFTPAGGTYRSARDLVDDNDGGAFAMTQRRALFTTLETAAGDSLVDETNDYVRVGDGSGPISIDGTVTANQGGSNWTINLAQVGGNTVTTGGVNGSFGVGGLAAHDGTFNGNPVAVGAYASAAAPSDVSADGDVTRLWALRSGALATQPTFGGVLAVAGNGASGTGVQRVTIANDSTGILAAVTSLTGFNGTTMTLGAGNVAAGTPRVTLAADDPLVARRASDPCSYGTKISVPISQTANTELFTGTASNRTYVCSIVLAQPAASTQTFSLVSGTGSTCGTSTGAMIGSTTAANGVQLPFAHGNGNGMIAKSDTDADNVCLFQSGSDRIAGVLTYVVAPN